MARADRVGRTASSRRLPSRLAVGTVCAAAAIGSMRRAVGQTEAASLISSSLPVASRYSCTQRSITVAVFSTLVNWPTT